MNGFIKAFLQLVAFLLVVFLLTGTWFLFDGLNDNGNLADVALVYGHAEIETGDSWTILQARLDKVIQLYNDKQFPAIIVSGLKTETYDEVALMEKYLEAKGIPASAIMEDPGDDNTRQMARRVAQIMNDKHYASIMIVGHYYQITRLKTALRLEGVVAAEHAHVGSLHKVDAINVPWDVVIFYKDLILNYGAPLTKKVAQETNNGVKNAKSSLDQKLDGMSK